MTPALAAISAGDLAWWSGDRPAAVRAWHEALDLADAGPTGRAAEAMARVRLLRREGNLAPFWHETKLHRALDACPDTEAWCAIAEADAALFLPKFAGGDPGKVAALLEGSPLVGPASARRRLADGRSALEGELDGMGQGMRDHGLRPFDPGTWTLGLGLSAAAGSGVGAALRFVHPDLGGGAHRLELGASGDTRGGFALSAALSARSTLPVQVAGAVARSVLDRYDEEAGTSTLWIERVSLGIAPRQGLALLQAGVGARWDDGAANLGPYAVLTLGGDTRLKLRVEAGSGDYDHLATGADGRVLWELSAFTLALHATSSVVHSPDTPWTREPYAGGTELLRGLPTGRFRDPWLAGAQVELRRPIWGPLRAAIFFDAALVEGAHWTAGGGLRLVLPPERDNVTRIDFGAGPEGWGLVVAWGEAF